MMKAPHEKPVIQIDITSACDIRECSNCTRLLTHYPKWYMSVANFRRAAESLADYPGVVGVFGGNPCVHPQFEEITRAFAEIRPERRTRGLWTNNFAGHGDIIADEALGYGYRNLNVHRDAKSAALMREAFGGNVLIHGEHREAWHSPILVAIKDMVPDEAAMWAMIEKCDINLKWSGAITEIKGELRAYFCEVASAFDHMYGEDNGLPVTPGWWKQGIEVYDAQVKRWCPSCGVPLKLKGQVDSAGVDDVSRTHLVQATISKRPIALHSSLHNDERTHETTDYMGYRK